MKREMVEDKKRIKYLVADTTAFINAVQLNEYAENVLTVPDVVAEIKNKRQIRRLCVLPFDLQVREPRVESVKHCVEFAKKTGDYASLSGIDIKVVALTYELEADKVGTEHLRNDPVLSETIASRKKPEVFQDKTELAGWYNPKNGEESDEYEQQNEGGKECISEINKYISNGNEETDTVKEAIDKQLEQNQCDGTFNTNYTEQYEVTQDELESLFENLKCQPEDNDESCDILVPERKHQNGESDTDNSAEADKSSLIDANIDELEGYDGMWITPCNIKKIKKSLEGKVEDNIIPEVACMSTDFAVQNVLKQINLHISTLDGRIIKHLRTYILRCYACFKTTSIMTKVFCPNCGNKTLKRVAVSLDENGKQVIHINTRRPLGTKYKNQSLPRFQGGKHSRNPILFEDQPIPRQMPSRVAKTKTNALNEDYVTGFSPFVMRDVDSKSAMLRSKGHLKEWARNNTFEEDRRRKHYNRLYK